MNSEKTQKRRLTKSERTKRKDKIIAFCVLLVVSVFFVFPLIYMLGTSFKSDTELISHPEKIFPSAGEWTIKHYSTFIINNGEPDKLPFWMLNSLWSSFLTVLLTVICDLMVAFALVFLQFRGKKVLEKFLYLWMSIPGIIGTAPSFAMFAIIRRALNITGGAGGYLYSYFWIIMPGISGIFNMLLMRNFFASIPKDIVDSAKSDGAKTMTIFWRIVVPLAKSTILLIVLFSFVGAWNNLIWPQLIFSGAAEGSPENFWKTVTVGLTTFTHGGWDQLGVSMAVSAFTMIPVIIIFIFTQNKMIDGLASTGIKM